MTCQWPLLLLVRLRRALVGEVENPETGMVMVRSFTTVGHTIVGFLTLACVQGGRIGKTVRLSDVDREEL